ncbi:hypothetical protein M413DRAFT_27617 [Hebeloma cylindrosporum]|uniref:F-box domain-containing protein n=1 Tax=Hebeloma cylindrosporum TaxID=76867 RepID=A0A0C3CAI6_HEBCY|nr:hypothetical protein M413DRAFT_27617 [Hebeloma cylindrosporum h7]
MKTLACRTSLRSYSRIRTKFKLLDLPTELLLDIAERLDNPTLLSLSRTCHNLHSLALCTFFAINDIPDPRSGSLLAYNAPLETLPALRIALFIQKLEHVTYYFSTNVERMLREVHDLRALISRMPSIRTVSLDIPLYLGYVPQVLNPEVWEKEFLGLLNLALEKGCYALSVEGREKLVKFYSKQVTKPTKRRKNPKRKRLTGAVRHRSPMDSFDETQEDSPILPPRNIKITRVSIYSDMLLEPPFFDWTIAMLDSGASTITTLLIYSTIHRPQKTWKYFLDAIKLPRLSSLDLVSCASIPFATVHSFLTHHSHIKTFDLLGAEVPKGIWPPPPLTIPILPHLQSISAPPFYLVWILNSLLLDKEAPQNVTDIAITPNYGKEEAFDYGLFDNALECVAAFPRDIQLSLHLDTSRGDSDIYDWFEEHMTVMDDSDPSKSKVISQLDNVDRLTIYFSRSWRRTEMLADWVGMLFPNVKMIRFEGLLTEMAVSELNKTEFVGRVMMTCQKAAWLYMDEETSDLEQLRRDFEIEISAKKGKGSRKGGSA